jgi:predicted glycoside hydrolase/deacetylase ChbG (UPF0249 family)
LSTARHFSRYTLVGAVATALHYGVLAALVEGAGWAAWLASGTGAVVGAQLAAFNHVLGRPPAFIDGHQHVHHLPGMRGVILDMVEHVQPLPALRNTGRLLGPGFGFKRWVIEHTGGRALEAELVQRVIPHNPVLLGAYDFVDPDYQGCMRRWLAELPAEGGLLFCHPGEHLPGDPPDAIQAARKRELAYLGSVAFDDDLAAAGVRLGRVWRTVTETSRPG